MCKLLGVGIRVTFGMLIIAIISGCTDDSPTKEVVAPPPLEEEDADHSYSVPIAHTVEVVPDARFPILSDTQFALKFDAGVDAANMNHMPATGAGRFWTARPGLELGTVWLQIEWINRDGSLRSQNVGPYMVVACGEMQEPPAMTGGTVIDGAIDVDPVPINAGGEPLQTTITFVSKPK